MNERPALPPFIPVEFTRLVFKTFNNRRGPYEPSEFDIRSVSEAIGTLRTLTGVTREELAKRVGMSVADLVNLERKGSPITVERMERFRDFSQRVCLYNLREYFDMQGRTVRHKKRHHQAKVEGRRD